MLTRVNKIIMMSFNSCDAKIKSQSHRFSVLNHNKASLGKSSRLAFLLARANGSAITRISDSWLKPYTDEPLHEPRRSSVNQATRKTGKMCYRKFGLLKSRLIIELIV